MSLQNAWSYVLFKQTLSNLNVYSITLGKCEVTIFEPVNQNTFKLTISFIFTHFVQTKEIDNELKNFLHLVSPNRLNGVFVRHRGRKNHHSFCLQLEARLFSEVGCYKLVSRLTLYCKLVMTFCLWFCAITAIYFRYFRWHQLNLLLLIPSLLLSLPKPNKIYHFIQYWRKQKE